MNSTSSGPDLGGAWGTGLDSEVHGYICNAMWTGQGITEAQRKGFTSPGEGGLNPSKEPEKPLRLLTDFHPHGLALEG